MRARRPARAAGLAAALLLGTTAAGCGASDDGSSRGPSGTATGAASSPASSPDTAPAATTSAAGASGGTAARPMTVAPTRKMLDWSPIDGDTDGTLLSNGTWVLSVPQDGSSFQLEGESGGTGEGYGGAAPRGFTVNDVLLDERWAVVVLQDKQEQRPEQATVYDLAHHGRTWRIDGGSDVPTTTGGSWTLAGDTLVHATVQKRSYCEARVDLAGRSADVGYCAPPRNGWNSPVLGPGGEALLTFDDGRPSCRTVVAVTGTSATPFEGVEKCTGAEGALLEDGAVWSVVPNEHRYEQVRVRARTGSGYYDLGPGTNGTLTVCGGAAYWARDPATDGGRAQLMRWDGRDLAVVYESGRGNAFLGAPVCAGGTIDVSSYSDAGDEAVSATVG